MHAANDWLSKTSRSHTLSGLNTRDLVPRAIEQAASTIQDIVDELIKARLPPFSPVVFEHAYSNSQVVLHELEKGISSVNVLVAMSLCISSINKRIVKLCVSLDKLSMPAIILHWTRLFLPRIRTYRFLCYMAVGVFCQTVALAHLDHPCAAYCGSHPGTLLRVIGQLLGVIQEAHVEN